MVNENKDSEDKETRHPDSRRSYGIDEEKGTRQGKRAEKLRKKKQKMKQHGKGLGRIYKDAVEKRGK